MNRLKAVHIRAATACCAGLIACIVLLASSSSRSSADSAVSNSAARFHQETAEFIEAELRLYPERATALGDHRFDDRVNDLSRAGATAVIDHAHEWIRIFGGDDPHALAAADEADREWLLAHLDGELLWNEQIRTYERDPGGYLPTSAINALIKRDFAPLPSRMHSVAAREIAALKNLEAARINLKPTATPKVAIEITLQQMAATIAFFRSDVPLAFAKLPDGPDKSNFARANANLIAAIEDYSRWLEHDLTPHASGKYAIGADAYRRMLADADMVDLPLEQLETVGVNELARLQAEFVKTAAAIEPGRAPADVMKALAREHPDSAEVLPAVASGLEDLRRYVLEHHLAAIPSDVLPLVRETPPYMRATTFASMDTPGPFEKSTEAFFYVTLPEPSWSAEKKAQLLAFYARPAISDTSVHEVYPGHYVQFLNNRLLPDQVRRIYHSGANAEGWALYCEQMMLDEGLHRGDPKYRLAQLQMALMRACRYLAGIRMHTRGMTVDEAAKFFETNAYQTPHNAMVEALRGTDDPGYLRYQLGKLMILKLREDVRRQQGAAFDLGKFHDDFLKQGAIPIKLIRRAMLGTDGPLL
ncbi:MAG: DUF885 domain-containing protein [Candidatus Binatus sp.]|uniref:DUF885 domain-containing protein n=1 Tax=Candidatus Binatus sp. TaxID=2811406 RepID=UPI002717637C|nr:DUF885 domain-containing protein [Candidatus Binatus sp.]MDO8434848.1 DUF885 domain-containing protein [Candidatus Binatus sp.]